MIGNDIKLTWDPWFASNGGASRGVLSIQDGQEKFDTPLTATLLNGGIFWYTPRGDRSEFVLEIVQPDGKRVRDGASARRPVLSGAVEGAVGVTAPAAPEGETATPPKVVKQPWPVVPESLGRAIANDVSLELTISIDRQGRVSDAQPRVAASGIAGSLGKIAADAARLWIFEPAKRGNQPVPCRITVGFLFAGRTGG